MIIVSQPKHLITYLGLFSICLHIISLHLSFPLTVILSLLILPFIFCFTLQQRTKERRSCLVLPSLLWWEKMEPLFLMRAMNSMFTRSDMILGLLQITGEDSLFTNTNFCVIYWKKLPFLHKLLFNITWKQGFKVWTHQKCENVQLYHVSNC